jgi:tight adherence protein C
MTGGQLGMLLGLTGSLGVLLVVLRLPRFRRLTMADRVGPYVRANTPTSLSFLLFRPLLARPKRGRLLTLLATRLDRVLGGRSAIVARLSSAGDRLTIDQYRSSQVLWGAAGALPGALALALGTVSGRSSLSLAGAALVIAGIAGGIASRDSALTREIKTREAAMLIELPAVADLFSLAVTAGESPLGAIQRVARDNGGPLREELGRVLADVRAGVPVVQALDAFAGRTSVTALARFLDGLVVAIERGTPLADVLRSQAADVREAAKQELIESGGRKEIAMMAPVVFFVLPTVVLFAAYPALTSLTFVTR